MGAERPHSFQKEILQDRLSLPLGDLKGMLKKVMIKKGEKNPNAKILKVMLLKEQIRLEMVHARLTILHSRVGRLKEETARSLSLPREEWTFLQSCRSWLPASDQNTDGYIHHDNNLRCGCCLCQVDPGKISNVFGSNYSLPLAGCTFRLEEKGYRRLWISTGFSMKKEAWSKSVIYLI